MAAIKTRKEAMACQLSGARHNTFQKINEFLLTVLQVRAEFASQTPNFLAEVRCQQRVAIEAFIRVADALLFCA